MISKDLLIRLSSEKPVNTLWDRDLRSRSLGSSYKMVVSFWSRKSFTVCFSKQTMFSRRWVEIHILWLITGSMRRTPTSTTCWKYRRLIGKIKKRMTCQCKDWPRSFYVTAQYFFVQGLLWQYNFSRSLKELGDISPKNTNIRYIQT